MLAAVIRGGACADLLVLVLDDNELGEAEVALLCSRASLLQLPRLQTLVLADNEFEHSGHPGFDAGGAAAAETAACHQPGRKPATRPAGSGVGGANTCE